MEDQPIKGVKVSKPYGSTTEIVHDEVLGKKAIVSGSDYGLDKGTRIPSYKEPSFIGIEESRVLENKLITVVKALHELEGVKPETVNVILKTLYEDITVVQTRIHEDYNSYKTYPFLAALLQKVSAKVDLAMLLYVDSL